VGGPLVQSSLNLRTRVSFAILAPPLRPLREIRRSRTPNPRKSLPYVLVGLKGVGHFDVGVPV
jgi:hypothetical protein